MLRNGCYSAWFRTPDNEGVGILTLADGKVTGNDTVISYSGFYTQNGDSFTATIATRRHAAGQPTILGIDEVVIEVVGTSKATTASCRGVVRQLPDVPFDVVLVRMEG